MVDEAARGDVDDSSALAGVPHALPSWRQAHKLQQGAAATGFAWPDPAPVIDKLAEELAEVREAVQSDQGAGRIEDEIGDMLFVLVNLCRHTGTDFDRALRHANAKFERRFRAMERHAQAQGRRFEACSLAEQQALWQAVKMDEQGGKR